MTLARSRLWSLCLITTLVVIGTVLPSSGAAKPGSLCKKVEQVRVVKGVSLKCVKAGKRLVWRKVATAPVVAPAAEVTPSPSASPTPSTSASPTTSATPTPSTPPDLVSFRNALVYGVRGSELIRRGDSGDFFEDDSRGKEAFSTVRQKAFDELNKGTRTSGHPNIEFVYDIRPSFPKFLEPFITRELSQAAVLWNDFFTRKTRIEVSLITEQDQEYIKKDPWIGANFPPFLDRLGSKRERPFISGGGIYWNDSRRTVGQVVLATASYLDSNYVNFEWPQVARHEFFHVVQDFALYGEAQGRNRSRFLEVQPWHYREGAANALSYLTAFRTLGCDGLDGLV